MYALFLPHPSRRELFFSHIQNISSYMYLHLTYSESGKLSWVYLLEVSGVALEIRLQDREKGLEGR